tara:strand:- start:17 stop:391 length:375 start_codon:yes stop_codon:yes gene_type:complete
MKITRKQLRQLIKEEISMHNMHSQNTDPFDILNTMDDKIRVISYIDNQTSDPSKRIVVVCQRLKDKYRNTKVVPENEYERAWDDVFENRYATEEDAQHDLRKASMDLQRDYFSTNPKIEKEDGF